MKRDHIHVVFCREYGDESLPPLRELVSEKPDEKKSVILDYLRTHCILASPGVVRDILDPESTIGRRDLYSDGVYFWADYLPAYIQKYNISIPTDFREHILNNYAERKKRHLMLKLVDRIVVRNNPYLGYVYEVDLSKNGKVMYRNSTDCTDGAFLIINVKDAGYIIDPIMTELFCYDEDEHGQAMIDGYHWQIQFIRKGELIKSIEGWPGESNWRHRQIKKDIEFMERFIPVDIGAKYMTDTV